MKTIDLIRFKGFEIANKNNLTNLPEKVNIKHNESLVESFMEVLLEDIFKFSTIEQYSNYETLFTRAFIYCFGKGAEYSLSYMLNRPLKKIGYNFDDCMTGKITTNFPFTLKSQLSKNISVMLEMYSEMFYMTKGSQERIISEGDSFPKSIFVILNAAFYWGRRVMLSQDLSKKINVNFSSNKKDIKYDYDNYDKRYKESDFKIINYEIRDFKEIEHLFDDKSEE